MEQVEQMEHVDNQLIDFFDFPLYLKFYFTIFNLINFITDIYVF